MQAITTKYLGPTDRRGARIKATTESGISVIVSYDYGLNHDGRHDKAVIALCEKLGWTGRLVSGGTRTGNVYVFDPAIKTDKLIIAQ